jgi:hypothetical protein
MPTGRIERMSETEAGAGMGECMRPVDAADEATEPLRRLGRDFENRAQKHRLDESLAGARADIYSRVATEMGNAATKVAENVKRLLMCPEPEEGRDECTES